MSEFFIVLSQVPQQHETLDDARADKRRLSKFFPDKTFTILRCKSWLHGAGHFPKIVTLLGDIVRDGLNDFNLERARILLLTVGNRTPNLKAVEGPPEFHPKVRA